MITIATITEFIGRFHPVLVHLPIGILLLAVVFYFLSYKKKFEVLRPAVNISLLLGTVAAVASCISGFLLSQSGDYDEALASKHQWFGIGVAAISVLTYYLAKKNSNYIKWLMPFVALLIIITGHLGGSLTHGEGYLLKRFSSKAETEKIVNKPIPHVQQAIVYSDIVQPILEARCYNCHGPNKQKGKLRLDEPSFIDKGGKTGKAIVAGSTVESELIKRILLPEGNHDHMPPNAKPQLTKEQIELLNWWVASGADYHKKVSELNQPEKIKPYLTALQTGGQNPVAASTDIPDKQVDKAPDSVIKRLMSLDVAVNPVAQNSNYLAISFVTIDSITTGHLQLLKALSKQIIWLKMGNIKLTDSALSVVGSLSGLTRLYLNRTNITDKGLLYLKNLSQLQYLNLSGTNVTGNGIHNLAGLKNLKQLFLYQTTISSEGLGLLKKTLTNTIIDTGGYKVKFLKDDTMKVNPKPVKN